MATVYLADDIKHERKVALKGVSMTRASLLIVAFLGLSACQEAESLRVDCDEGDAIACGALGEMYYYGDGVTQDLARAASLLQRACDGGIMGGCNDLGFMYETGEGITQDLARALSLYRQACDGGAIQGCDNLAVMYENGAGVAPDLERAVSLYQQACDGGGSGGLPGRSSPSREHGTEHPLRRGAARDSISPIPPSHRLIITRSLSAGECFPGTSTTVFASPEPLRTPRLQRGPQAPSCRPHHAFTNTGPSRR